jgi:hypothetical protein
MVLLLAADFAPGITASGYDAAVGLVHAEFPGSGGSRDLGIAIDLIDLIGYGYDGAGSMATMLLILSFSTDRLYRVAKDELSSPPG